MFSASWYRVATLKPKLRQNAQLHRQPFGDDVTYLLQDHGTGKFYRFNAVAHDIIGRMDGERSVQEIWDAALTTLGDDAPTQDEMIEVLGRLHGADVLQGGVTPDCVELFRRGEKQRRQGWTKHFRNPLAIRIPLLDPDHYLDKIVPWAGRLFTTHGLFIWATVVVIALLQLGPHWNELRDFASAHALQPNNLALLAVLYPVVKALHELGHGLATKRWGGEVHEMGVTLLVFVPIPYVDASASTAFRRKGQRIVVSAAGMMVELFVASIALFVWINVEAGLARSAAFDVMLIAGVSTLLFNANPLLKFDGYYILEDAIEIPGLASRSTKFLIHLLKRYLLGLTDSTSPVNRSGETGWLLGYGVGASAYRWLITLSIIWFVAGEYFLVGVVIAVWAATAQILIPIGKALGFVLFDPRVARNRLRAVGATGALLALAIVAFGIVPAPTATYAQGVLYPADDRQIKAGANGSAYKVLVQPFETVRAGQPILELDAPFLSADLALLRAEYLELDARHRHARVDDRVKAKGIEEELSAKQAEIERAQEKVGNLVVHSPAVGRFIPLDFDALAGRYFRKGDAVGYVVSARDLAVRVVVPQGDVGRLREGIRAVSVKFANRPEHTHAATVVQAVPAAQTRLLNKALGQAGGGDIPVDPSDPEGRTVVNTVFQFELALVKPLTEDWVGLRAHIRFEHDDEPLAQQLYRAGRQLFLNRFGV
jgi:putative peptide zinc metalloprotease protein